MDPLDNDTAKLWLALNGTEKSGPNPSKPARWVSQIEGRQQIVTLFMVLSTVDKDYAASNLIAALHISRVAQLCRPPM